MLPFLLLLLSSAFSSSPPGDSPAVVQEPGPTTTVQDLDAALEVYLSGDLAGARADIRRLTRLPDFEASERREEALIYLAEIEYYLGEREAAWSTCQRLVQLSPDYRVDPFVHPPELVAFFDSVRAASLATQAPSTSTDRAAIPAWALFLPGGIQLHQDQDALGILAITGVGGLAASSAGLYTALKRYDLDLQRPGIQVTSTEDLQRADSLLLWTNVTRWSAASLYGLGLLHGLLSMNGLGGTQQVTLTPNGLMWTW